MQGGRLQLFSSWLWGRLLDEQRVSDSDRMWLPVHLVKHFFFGKAATTTPSVLLPDCLQVQAKVSTRKADWALCQP
jgi:hypothetical protein